MLRQIVDLDVTDTGGVVQAPDDGGVRVRGQMRSNLWHNFTGFINLADVKLVTGQQRTHLKAHE